VATGDTEDDLRLDLARRAARLTTMVNELAIEVAIGQPTPGFRLMGTGLEQVDAGFAALEASCTTQMGSLMPVIPFEPWDTGPELDRRSRDRGIELISIFSERAFRVNPLLTSLDPTARVGHAVTTMWVIDRSCVVLPGPLELDGSPTLYTATTPDLVDPALELWDLVLADSRPALAEGEAPPFTPRQVQTAILLARGAKDASIARELGVSVRTVVSEIAQLVARLGANSRVDAVLILRRGRARA